MFLPTFEIQGHRGARGLRPENTLPSFEAALDAGATSLETDVQITADGVPVLFHDPRLHSGICRLADESDLASEVPINELDSSDLARFVADRNPDPRRFPGQAAETTPLAVWFCRTAGSPYRIPTLADLLRFVADYAGEPGRAAGKTDAQRANARRAVIDVEIKHVPFLAGGSSQAVEVRAVDTLRSHWPLAQARVRSFDHRCVLRMRQMQPRITGVVLVEGTAPVDPVSIARAADAAVYAPDCAFLDEEQVRQCHAADIAVIPWTVNDPVDWERLVGWDVDGITTDDPGRLASWLRDRRLHG